MNISSFNKSFPTHPMPSNMTESLEVIANREENIDVLLGNDSSDSGDDILNADIEKHQNSVWLKSVNRISNRPKGWLNRLKNEIDESDIFIPPVTKAEARMQRKIASGFVDVIIPKPNLPMRKPLLSLDNLKASSSNGNSNVSKFSSIHSSQYCCTCWKIVPVGCELVQCQYCTIVSHLYCIQNIQKFVQKKLSKDEEKEQNLLINHHKNRHMRLIHSHQHSFRHGHSQSNLLIKSHSARQKNQYYEDKDLDTVSTPFVPQSGYTAKDIKWTCSFCENEVTSTNNYRELSYKKKLYYYGLLLAILRMQSFLRMVHQRKIFVSLVRSAITLQRVFRLKKLKRQQELEQINSKYCFRLRLHDIFMLIKNENNPHFVKQNDTIGSTHAASSPKHAPAIPDISNHLPMHIIGDMVSSTFDKIFGPNHQFFPPPVIAEKDQEMIDYVSIGHVEGPVTFAKTYKSLQIPHKGSLFLTVSVHEKIDLDLFPDQFRKNNLQVIRFDLPLKLVHSVSKLKISILKNQLGYSSLDTHEFEKLAKHYTMASYSTAKPYLLIPYTIAHSEVRLTLSEVYEWPKCTIIGQFSYPLQYPITKKRCLTLTQSLSPKFNHTDIPQDDGGKVMFMTRSHQTQAQTLSNEVDSNNTVNSTTHSYAKPLTHDGLMNDNINNKAKDYNLELNESFITYTLMTIGYSDVNEMGYMNMLNQEIASSTKKKVWCILVDRLFHVFSAVKDLVKFKICFDIFSSSVAMLADEVIQVKTSTDTLFLSCNVRRDNENWF
eukprot:gene6714-9207_t